MSDALRGGRWLTAIARGPPQSTYLWASTTSSQVAAGPSRHRLHAAGCSATGGPTATRPIRTSQRHVKRTYSYSLHRAGSRSLTPPCHAIGYNRKLELSFNRFFWIRVSILKKSLTSLTSTTFSSVLCLFVCLFVTMYAKNTQPIFTKFSGKVA